MPFRGIKAHDRPVLAEHEESMLWVGALSFEERCVASLERLVAAGHPPALALLLEYPTDVRPVAQDRERRRRNRERIDTACRGVSGLRVTFVEVDPYSYRAGQRAVADALAGLGASHVVLDVSCLTKIHAIALAAPSVFAASLPWQIAYSMPETYGHLESSAGTGPGWRDVLVLPIGDSADVANETHARGIILAGHEGDRLVIALAETEPAGGVIITTNTERRPDLRKESERRNRKVTQLLVGRGDERWSIEDIALKDPAALSRAVETEINKALAEAAPVLLYPFGPKPFVALGAMQLAATPDLQGWFVYPIAVSYDVDYSYGVGNTVWYAPEPPSGYAQESLPLERDI